MLDNKEDLLTCQCGSIFFEEIRSKTYLKSRFVFYGDAAKSQLQHEDVTIPVAKCLFCGTVYIPGTSFSGLNQLNRAVQCYGELIDIQKNYEIKTSSIMQKINNIGVDNVKAEPNSESNPAHVVRPSPGRGKSSKANKE